MKAIVLKKSCRAQELTVSQISIPEVRKGWVLVKIKAFGLNHAEILLRQYEVDADYIRKPIVPGIECVGVVEDPSDSGFKRGDKVLAFMGGMGRSFHGSYAEYALLPQTHVFLVETEMDWVQLGAIPETFYTAFGSLFTCLQIQKSDVILIHGGTSALGYAAIQLAKAMGCVVIATSRKAERLKGLIDAGAEYGLIDDTSLVERIRELFPEGISKVLELVGQSAVKETARTLKNHGILCSTGQLGGGGSQGFDIIKEIPNGVYLTSFYSNTPQKDQIAQMIGFIEYHHINPVIGRVLPLEDIGLGHQLMENNEALGKIVITVDIED